MDVKYVYISKDYSSLIPFQECLDSYELITDQFIDQFIANTESHESIRNQSEVAIAKLNALISGNKNELILAIHLESELIGEVENEADLYELIAFLEAEHGYFIDEKKTSVKKFYTHLKLLKNGKKADKE